MSTDFVTSTGLLLPTLAEIKLQLETDFQAVFGTDIDLSPEGPFGQFVDLMSKSISDAYLAAQEIYTARHPNEATGTSLDNISAETGIRRIDSTASQVQDAVLYGNEGTVVTAGRAVRRENTDLLYGLDADVTISKTSARDAWLEPTDESDGLTTSFTVDGITVSYVASGDTIETIVDALVLDAQTTLAAFITAGGTVVKEDTKYVRVSHPETDFTVDWNVNVNPEKVGSIGDFTCVDTGPNTMPLNALTVITTPVSGWTEVNNPFFEGVPGRAEETDTELRIRRATSLGAGSATEEAIRSKLLNTVEGVSEAGVVSNRTMVTDGEGRPPKSFEAIVEGGTDTDIGLSIWNNMPAGIEAYGTTLVQVQDSTGTVQDIYFSRPTQLYLHVTTDITLDPEQSYPADGDNAIREAIVAWAAVEYTLGRDVLYQKISVPVFSVEGIASVSITVDLTANPTDTPTYVAQNIMVSERELVIADTSRIVVNQV